MSRVQDIAGFAVLTATEKLKNECIALRKAKAESTMPDSAMIQALVKSSVDAAIAKAMQQLPKFAILDPNKTHTCKALPKVEADENGDLRLVAGIVLEPNISDAQKDTYSEEEIRKTAHLWMLDFQNIGLQHKAIVNHGVQPVESFIAPVDMTIEDVDIAKGTWLLVVKVFDDDLWDEVKKGTLNGFSIGGFARRIPLDGSDSDD